MRDDPKNLVLDDNGDTGNGGVADGRYDVGGRRRCWSRIRQGQSWRIWSNGGTCGKRGVIREEGAKAHAVAWEQSFLGDGLMDGGFSLIKFGVLSCLCLCDLLLVVCFTLKQHCVTIPNTMLPSTHMLD